MDPELRGRVKRLAKAADRHDMIMLTADQRCLARDTADLLHAYDALRAENEKLRDERDSAIGCRYRAERELGATRYDLTAERKRSAKLVEALDRYYVITRVANYGVRCRQADELRAALAAYRHSDEPAKEEGHE